ncbi:hypothetical protein TEA_016608 [Camellia sinensis var. sinensis]|uniref:Peptidase C1A papain C-terminal domain-containing protein n=1 Tax=Camellia sinensis var. sinensis TaxID=542762 RepID=A0A4S4EXY6_CAMSN|nr:hypothetical protein TEA_016608 [Camellia sinensis var. sinensis]
MKSLSVIPMPLFPSTKTVPPTVPPLWVAQLKESGSSPELGSPSMFAADRPRCLPSTSPIARAWKEGKRASKRENGLLNGRKALCWCDPEEYGACDSGCNGGLMTTAFEYTLKAGGLEKEEDYPYTGRDRGPCKFDNSKIAASVSNFSVISVDEDQVAANLIKNGPLAVGINAAYMQTYIGGVSCPYICSKHLDHGVLLVGYGSAAFAPIRLKKKPYWIVKNSWGANWGENGYYYICRGPKSHNVCGVDSMVSTVAAIHTTTQ